MNDRPDFLSDRSAASLAAVVATFIMIWWATAPRRDAALATFASSATIESQISVWDVAGVLPALAIPLLLFYLLTATAMFRPNLSAEGLTRQPNSFAWGGFLLLHGLTLIWLTFQDTWPAAVAFFTVILGGLLFGWRLGSVAGFMVTLAIMFSDLFRYGLWLDYREAVPNILREEGLISLLQQLFQDLQWLLLGPDRAAFIWAGLIAGCAFLWLGRRRLQPLAGFLVGLLLSYAGVIMPTLGYDVPNLFTPGDAGLALTVSIGIVLALLILRSVQGTVARAEAEIARTARLEAELLALRAQINPHFFFNSLNTIRHLVRVDPPAARDLLLDLSTIFQRVLRAGDHVSLREELEHVAAYLNLEKARLEERLTLEIATPPADLLETPVPTLTLQPLVENAVVHGLAQRRAGGCVRLEVTPHDSDLNITISDDGVGMSRERLTAALAGTTQRGSIGLRNVDQRLRALYGDAYGLAITSAPDEGTTVTVRLPRRQQNSRGGGA